MQSYAIDSSNRLEWSFNVRVFEVSFYTQDQDVEIDDTAYTSPTFTASLTNRFSYDISTDFTTTLTTTSTTLTYTDNIVPSSTTQMDIEISAQAEDANAGAHTFTISVTLGTSTLSDTVTLTFCRPLSIADQISDPYQVIIGDTSSVSIPIPIYDGCYLSCVLKTTLADTSHTWLSDDGTNYYIS